MKIDAGGRLKTRNPAHAPISSARVAATNHCSDIAAAARKQSEATEATPAARPSMLSMKLSALVTARNQRTVRDDREPGPARVVVEHGEQTGVGEGAR
jgi:hypothetical protein